MKENFSDRILENVAELIGEASGFEFDDSPIIVENDNYCLYEEDDTLVISQGKGKIVLESQDDLKNLLDIMINIKEGNYFA